MLPELPSEFLRVARLGLFGVETMLLEETNDITPSHPVARLISMAAFRCTTGRKSSRPTRWNGSSRRSSPTDANGVSPNTAAALRLAGCLLIEVPDEWRVVECR